MRMQRRKLDSSKWIEHFKEQAKGIRHPARDGYILVGNQKGQGGGGNTPPVQIVTPVQQAVNQAKEEIKRRGIKRKSYFPKNQLKKKARTGKKSSSSSKKRKPKKKRQLKGKKVRRDIFTK